jgi:hypothetical protein
MYSYQARTVVSVVGCQKNGWFCLPETSDGQTLQQKTNGSLQHTRLSTISILHRFLGMFVAIDPKDIITCTGTVPNTL